MNNLFQIPAKYFTQAGYFYPNKTSIINLVLISSFFIIYVAQMVLFAAQFLFFQNNINDFVDNVEGVGAYAQVIGKLFVLLYHRKMITKLISLRNKFLNSDGCSNKLQTELKNISSNIILFQKIMVHAFDGIVFVILLTIIFFGRTLPCGSWQIPNQQIFYTVLLCLTVGTLPLLSRPVANFDNLYLGFCFEMIMQFKILYFHIENLNIEHVQSPRDVTLHYIKLKSAIEHHQFLLRYIDDVKKIFSICLLLQYATIVPITVCELYAVSISPSYGDSARYIVMGLGGVVQMSQYCLSADFLAQEALKISTAIYSSNWYSKHFKVFRIPTLMFLRASQKEIEFSASGLIAFNARTLVHVFRVVLSANTFLRSITE